MPPPSASASASRLATHWIADALADDESLAAVGADPMDPACRIPAAQAGRAQGRRVAAEVAAFLS